MLYYKLILIVNLNKNKPQQIQPIKKGAGKKYWQNKTITLPIYTIRVAVLFSS